MRYNKFITLLTILIVVLLFANIFNNIENYQNRRFGRRRRTLEEKKTDCDEYNDDRCDRCSKQTTHDW